MDEILNFDKLSLEDKDDETLGKLWIGGRGDVQKAEIMVDIEDSDKEYENVCMQRWPGAYEYKAVLGRRNSNVKTWKQFYMAMEKFGELYGHKKVQEQRRKFGESGVYNIFKERRTGTVAQQHKRMRKPRQTLELPLDYSVIAVAASADFAAVLVTTDSQSSELGGTLCITSTSAIESSDWRRTSAELRGFQTAYISGSFLFTICDNSINIYHLPRGELKYSLDVWEKHRIVLKENAISIAASSQVVVVVSRSRGVLFFVILDQQLHLVHYRNTITEQCSYQYTAADISFNTVALGRSDGLLEIWLLDQTESSGCKLIGTHNYLEPIVSSSGKKLNPTQGLAINCIAFDGFRFVLMTERDTVMVSYSKVNPKILKITNTSTIASVAMMGDFLCQLHADGGLDVVEFGSGLTHCNTMFSVEDADLHTVPIGKQFAFISGGMAGALYPNGNFNLLNQTLSKY